MISTLEEKVYTKGKANTIGKILGIDWSKFDVDQFRMGLVVELEHGKVCSGTNVTDSDPLVTGKIALAHLDEIPDYYTRLEKMKNKADKYWSSK